MPKVKWGLFWVYAQYKYTLIMSAYSFYRYERKSQENSAFIDKRPPPPGMYGDLLS